MVVFDGVRGGIFGLDEEWCCLLEVDGIVLAWRVRGWW